MRFLGCILFFVSSCLTGHEMSRYFAEQEEGAFLLMDLADEERLIEYNPQLCATPLSPCSTFKIPNALIGLDLGILKDEHALYVWDGTPQQVSALEKDHTLETAIHYSAIWYFQKLAEEVGVNQYREYLAKFHYGNRDISGGLTQFWLGKSLLISPDNQLQFLADFYKGKLPVSEYAAETVKRILIYENTHGWVLSGNTGCCTDQHLGWFIGYVRKGVKEYVFVTCMRGGNSSGSRAKAVTQEILQDLFAQHDSSG